MYYLLYIRVGSTSCQPLDMADTSGTNVPSSAKYTGRNGCIFERRRWLLLHQDPFTPNNFERNSNCFQ